MFGGSDCAVVFAVVTGVVVTTGFAGVDAVGEAAGVVVEEPVVAGGGVLVDGVVEGVVDGVVLDAVVEGGVVPPTGVVAPVPELVAVVVEGVVALPVAGGVVDGVVVGVVVLEAVEPVPVVGGVVDVAAGVLVSPVAAALPQMSSFETLLSVLPVVEGVVVDDVAAGGVVVTGVGGVVDVVAFAPLLP